MLGKIWSGYFSMKYTYRMHIVAKCVVVTVMVTPWATGSLYQAVIGTRDYIPETSSDLNLARVVDEVVQFAAVQGVIGALGESAVVVAVIVFAWAARAVGNLRGCREEKKSKYFSFEVCFLVPVLDVNTIFLKPNFSVLEPKTTSFLTSGIWLLSPNCSRNFVKRTFTSESGPGGYDIWNY